MDAPTWLLPRDIIHHNVVLSRQAIGRFGRTCKENQQWYRNLMICKDPHNNDCTSPLCCFLSQSSRIPMEPLVFYAKEYYEDKSKNIDAKNMFIHLWRHHDKERSEAITALRGIKSLTYDDCLEIYAGRYGVEEAGHLYGLNTDLAVSMKSAVVESNSLKLKIFLTEKNLIAIETLLLADTLLFNPDWSKQCGHGYNKKDTILDCACDLNDIGIMNQIVDASRIDCVIDAIKSMIERYRIELLDPFIRKHYEKAREERFVLWRHAIQSRFNRDPALDLQIFQKIVTLLFSQEIDAQDEHKRSLLHWTIEKDNFTAVYFLIKQGANINLPDYDGFLPLYNAYESPEITQLLIESGVDVNQRNAWNRTALMSAICHGKCNTKTLKVMDSLLKAGADATVLDDEGKSVLHLFEERNSHVSDDKRKMIGIFMKLGVRVDQEDNNGKTPLDYAQQNQNVKLIEVFELHTLNEKLNEARVLNEASRPIHKTDQVPERRVNPIPYEKIVAMSGVLLCSMATIYYLLRNVDFTFGTKK